MRVIVTRAQREARLWVRELTAHGFEASPLPLIQIAALADQGSLRRCTEHLADYISAMFVSAAAVEHFFAVNVSALELFAGPPGTGIRAWATGPGTAAALRALGVTPGQIDVPAQDSAQFDSEALWQQVRSQVHAGDRVLIVRGTDAAIAPGTAEGSGRDWLAEQLVGVGARVDFVVAYQRQAPVLSVSDRDLAQRAASDGSVWLFSSSQALRNLESCLPGQNWQNACALATHRRIAAHARGLGFALVHESRPTLPDVMATLKLCDEF